MCRRRHSLLRFFEWLGSKSNVDHKSRPRNRRYADLLVGKRPSGLAAECWSGSPARPSYTILSEWPIASSHGPGIVIPSDRGAHWYPTCPFFSLGAEDSTEHRSD